MKHPDFREFLLAVAVIACGTSTALSAEKWSCDMGMGGKTYKQEWIVSSDRMFAPKGKGFFRVVLNNSDTLLAFFRLLPNDPKNRPRTIYVLIAKSSGVVTEIDDIAMNTFISPEAEKYGEPNVTVGHCSLEHP